MMDSCEIQMYDVFPLDGCRDCSNWGLCCLAAGLDPETGCPSDA